MEKDFIPSSISHRRLDGFLKVAKKEKEDSKTLNQIDIAELEKLNHVSKEWAKKTKELILVLHNKPNAAIEGRSSKSLMALGALEVHLKMAIQALKAAELE